MKGMVFSSGSRERRLVGRRHHLDDAGMGLGGCDIEKVTSTARDAAYRENRVEHSWRMVVGGIAGAAGDFEDPVKPSDRLAYVRAVPNMGRCWDRCDSEFRHGRQLRKRWRREKREGRERAQGCRRRRA